MLDAGGASLERMHFAGEVALLPPGHSHQLDPIMSSHIPINNLVGSVRRAIADNHPFDRPDRLSDDRLERLLDMGLLVPRGRYQDIGQLRRLHRSAVPRFKYRTASPPNGAAKRSLPPPWTLPACRISPVRGLNHSIANVPRATARSTSTCLETHGETSLRSRPTKRSRTASPSPGRYTR